MIRFIAAIDNKNGIADEHGIPWQGKIPSDTAYYRAKIRNQTYIIGYGTYAQHKNPIPHTNVLVATHKSENLIPGFKIVSNPTDYINKSKVDIWIGGGEVIFKELFGIADELYITQIEGDFHCTKFLPEFREEFKLIHSSEKLTENGINFTFQIWNRK